MAARSAANESVSSLVRRLRQSGMELAGSPMVAAFPARDGSRSSSLTATLIPIPTMYQGSDAPARVSIRMPATLRPGVSHTSFGHLIWASGPHSSATATAAASGRTPGSIAPARSTKDCASTPAGELQLRPCRPRPLVCVAADTSVPCGAPASASARAWSLVEPTACRCRCGRPITGRLGCADRQSVVVSERKAIAGRATIHRDRQGPVGVLVDQQVPGRGVGERGPVDGVDAVDHDALSEP